MRVLQINTEVTMASPGRIACDLARVLKENGHDTVIAYGRGESPKDLKSIKITNDLDVKIHALKARVLDNVGFNSKQSTKEFIKKIEDYNPDIIHLHNLHGYYINIEILFDYLKEANKPVVWTLHDCWAFTGHCAYFDYVGCEKWKNGCGNCPQKDSYPNSKVADNSRWNYEKKKELFTSVKNMTIVTPSKWLANLVKESFLGKYNVEVINNGIDLDVFKPTESNFREKYNLQDKFIVLGVASIWEERKGLKYFIELSKILGDEYKIVIVGVDEKQKKELPKNIISITRTNNVRELAEIYTAADVFVNPTLEDNFPTTNLESLACGTPVITFNTGGSIESINEVTGLVVDKLKFEDLICKVKVLKNRNFNINDCINRSKLFDKYNRYNEYISNYSDLIK